ncbi:RloB family protein [Jonesiaceae bacterium BS-20]|uniref:RloB family protein n=1 Tax=Jonesiaceae bacterium BS-20 TaxID=3120821 RepID=A0AAU7DXK4_9MICO
MSRAPNFSSRKSQRKKKRTILIVTNGERTEMLYLKELKRRANLTDAIVKVKFVAGEPSTLVRKLEAPHGDLTGFDEIWLVVDEDGKDRAHFLQECIKACTKVQQWVAILSIPSFEVWLIAHYEQVRRYSDQAGARQHFRSLISKAVPDKELPKNFPFENIPLTVTQCRLVNTQGPVKNSTPSNPGSAMPLLVERLNIVP